MKIVPLHPMAESSLEAEIHKLVETSRLQGELECMVRLHGLGVPMCLSNDVSMAEFISALELAGLTLSTTDDVQLIHRQRDA
jgi:hypothetical protein